MRYITSVPPASLESPFNLRLQRFLGASVVQPRQLLVDIPEHRFSVVAAALCALPPNMSRGSPCFGGGGVKGRGGIQRLFCLVFS